MEICLQSVSACRSQTWKRRLAGKGEIRGGMPCPRCPEGLADTLTDPSASPLLGMATGKPLAHLAQSHTLCFLPFLWICPADACDVPMCIFLGMRGTGCLQLLHCSTAVGLGLPSVTALHFNWDGTVPQRSIWALAATSASGVSSPAWAEFGFPLADLLSPCLPVQQWDKGEHSGMWIRAMGHLVLTYLCFSPGKLITGDNAALGLPCHCPVVSYWKREDKGLSPPVQMHCTWAHLWDYGCLTERNTVLPPALPLIFFFF